MHKPLNWSPFVANPLDYLEGRVNSNLKLVTPEGEPVRILNEAGTGFVVYIDDKRHLTGFDNVNCCYFLNQAEVGINVP